MCPVTVEYVAFGEMALRVDGIRQPLTRRRERDVLSVLLVNHGAPVAAERLLAEVWGDEAPGQTLSALQVAVSRLRTLLEPDRQARKGSRLVSTAAGYALAAEVGDVDTWRFEEYAEAALAAASPAERLQLSEEGTALWTSTPYAECGAPLVRAEVGRLEELLLTVQEHRARTLIDLGRPDEAQRALADLSPRHPYRERLWSLLALSQYQCSRQADALETLRTLRQALADELGVDPSAEIQQLEQAVLRQDPELAAATPRQPATVAASAKVPPVQRRRDSTGTVGRESVLDLTVSLLEDARSTETTRFLLVAGEPGIGKSRLVNDLSEEADAAGFRILVGRCHEGDYAPALWPWLGIVRALADDQGTGGPDPLLAPLLDGAVTVPAEGGGTGLRMFDAVVEMLTRAAAAQPLLLVVEDIHWADATSLQLVRHLAGSDVQAPIAVVCTRRTTEATTSDALVDTMAALARAGAERVRLDGLDAAAVSALLQTSVGAHDPQLDTIVADATGGNPFFVLQYARVLAGLPDLERVDPAALPVPDGIRDVLRQRIQRLPDEAVRALTSAAVLGHRIDPDLVAELTGTPVDECLDLLDLAMTSGLVEEHDTGYAFVHALARETLYAEPSTARRMRLHDRAGRVIENLHGDVADAAAAIAHHTHLAAPLGPAYAERACTWLARAAEVATVRHAHPEALELWESVVDHAAHDSVTTAEALCGVSAALLRMARTPEARQAMDRAVRLGRDLGRWDLVARGAAILNGAGVWTWREHGVRDDAFIAILTEAAKHLGGPERASVLATLQVEHYYGWDSSVGDAIGRESVEVARQSGDSAVLIEVVLMRVLATYGPGLAEERLALLDELAEYDLQGELQVFVLFQRGHTLYECGRPGESDDVMRQCASAAAALPHTGVEIPLAWWWFARARDLDDPEGPALARAAVELHRASGYIANEDLECLAAVRLNPPGAPVDDRALEHARVANPGLRSIVAHAVLEAGDPDTARELLGEPAPATASDYSVFPGHCLRVIVLAETGSPEEVRAAVERIEPYAGEACTYGSVDHLGGADHFLAYGYAALGDPRALEYAERAVVLNERLQCAPWRRRSEALVARLSG